MIFLFIFIYLFILYILWAAHPNYNRPENKSEMTNNDQTCANTIKNTLKPGFTISNMMKIHAGTVFNTPGAPK